MFNPDTPKQETKPTEKELIAELKTKMRKYLSSVDHREFDKWQQECLKIVNESFSPVERQKYRLWYAFVGGTGYGDAPYFDFPGECSLQKMIEKLPD